MHIVVRCPEPQFEPSNMVLLLGAPNVVVVVSACRPKVTKQCLAIPGVWGQCPQCLMPHGLAALDAEDDVHTTV